MEQAQQICVEHTKKIFGGKIGLMFYDMTTLYFETFRTGVLTSSLKKSIFYNRFIINYL